MQWIFAVDSIAIDFNLMYSFMAPSTATTDPERHLHAEFYSFSSVNEKRRASYTHAPMFFVHHSTIIVMLLEHNVWQLSERRNAIFIARVWIAKMVNLSMRDNQHIFMRNTMKTATKIEFIAFANCSIFYETSKNEYIFGLNENNA